MNQNRNLEILTNQLAMVLEALEEYIRKENCYSDWTSKEQFFNRTMPKNETTSEKAENHFFSQFYVASTLFFNTEKNENHRKETQKEFYKWIDYSGITAENCPKKLKHILNEINEALENGNSRLYSAYEAASEKENRETINLDLKNPLHCQAYLEINKEFGYVPQTEKEQRANYPKYYEVKIKGDAEQGQKTFQQIKNSIVSQPEWTFPLRERYYQKLKEKIKELEEKKDRPKPKDEREREMILEAFAEETLMSLELYIQKLDYYPGWKTSEWTEQDREDWRKNWENKTSEEIKGLVLIDLKGDALRLRYFKADDPAYYPVLLNELKVKFAQWKSKRKIDPSNCPEQLRQILFEIDEVLEGNWIWKKNKADRKNNNEDKTEEIAKIMVEIKLKLAELKKEYRIDLGPQLNNWESKLMASKNISEAKSYQQQIEQKIQAAKAKHQAPATTNENENKLSWPVKIAFGAGIIGLVLGIIVLIDRVVKNRKVKK